MITYAQVSFLGYHAIYARLGEFWARPSGASRLCPAEVATHLVKEVGAATKQVGMRRWRQEVA